ncbi:SAV_6107 family HEPN domain-containing protein [Kitasatospora sp. NPDC049258]|uniref:SAV_6107 family HEPN domain-containing protein n=1 Tax=Kitasatospora sp. NPDC049258 TaxID=3155394 RepID=UPI0034414F45
MTISRPEPVTRRPVADQLPATPLPSAPAISPPATSPPRPAAALLPHARGSDVHPVPRRATAPPAALDLLRHAHRTLEQARALQDPLERYATAHLAALRTTAAVLAVHGRPERHPRRRQAIRSAWELLPEVAPELAEWAVYFAAGARRRAAAEAGITGAATARDADDLIRNTALYLRIVQRLLGLSPAPPAQPLPLEEAG